MPEGKEFYNESSCPGKCSSTTRETEAEDQLSQELKTPSPLLAPVPFRGYCSSYGHHKAGGALNQQAQDLQDSGPLAKKKAGFSLNWY